MVIQVAPRKATSHTNVAAPPAPPQQKQKWESKVENKITKIPNIYPCGVSLYKGKDTRNNLRIVTHCHKEQLEALTQAKWQYVNDKKNWLLMLSHISFNHLSILLWYAPQGKSSFCF